MVLVLVLTILGAVSCVPGKTYRTQLKTADYCVARDMRDCPSDALHLVAGAPQGVSSPLLGFVEFDDQGYLREPVLKDGLVRHLSSLAATRPLLVVVFSHGWIHNADPADGNVAAFSKLLLDLAAADAEGCANTPCQARQVVGVYVGWRGLSNRLEPFKTLSFWDRKGRAHRVGGDGATEVLTELAKVNASNRENRLVNSVCAPLRCREKNGKCVFCFFTHHPANCTTKVSVSSCALWRINRAIYLPASSEATSALVACLGCCSGPGLFALATISLNRLLQSPSVASSGAASVPVDGQFIVKTCDEISELNVISPKEVIGMVTTIFTNEQST